MIIVAIQVVDAMVMILSCIGTKTEMLVSMDTLYNDCYNLESVDSAHSISTSMCLALRKYAESANKKSRVRLADKKFLNTLLSLVTESNITI